MRIGVVSDSHNMGERRLQEAAEALRARGIDQLVHLGDGERDAARLQELLDVPLAAVAGNCDHDSKLAEEITLRVEDRKLLLRHGHRNQVKSTLLPIMLRAEELECDAVLFGHTHQSEIGYRNGILFLNPGALRDGHYAVLEFHEGHIAPFLYEI